MQLKSASGWKSVEFIAFHTIYLLPIRVVFFMIFSSIQLHSNKKEPNCIWTDVSMPAVLFVDMDYYGFNFARGFFSLYLVPQRLRFMFLFWLNSLQFNLLLFTHISVHILAENIWNAAKMQRLYCLWKLKWIEITVLMCLVCFELQFQLPSSN